MSGGAARALCFSLLLSTPLRAAPPALEAQLDCEPVSRPGRVLCEVKSRARAGTLVWSDVLVVRAPDFARPLRSRVLTELLAKDSAVLTSRKLALVATAPGQGRLELLVRAVICRAGGGEPSCSAETVTVTTWLSVAAPPAPRPGP